MGSACVAAFLRQVGRFAVGRCLLREFVNARFKSSPLISQALEELQECGRHVLLGFDHEVGQETISATGSSMPRDQCSGLLNGILPLGHPQLSSRILPFPYLSDRAIWLALALEALVRRVTGTIVGTIFVIVIRRSGASITPRVECLGQASRVSSSLLPDRWCGLHPEHFDESRKRGGLLLLTRIVEERARERRTPIFQHADQCPAREVVRHAVFCEPSKASPVESGLNHQVEVVEDQRTVDSDRERPAALIEFPLIDTSEHRHCPVPLDKPGEGRRLDSSSLAR